MTSGSVSPLHWPSWPGASLPLHIAGAPHSWEFREAGQPGPQAQDRSRPGSILQVGQRETLAGSGAHPRGDSMSAASLRTGDQRFSEFSRAHFSATNDAIVTVALPVLHKATDLNQKEEKGWPSWQLLGCLGNAAFWGG